MDDYNAVKNACETGRSNGQFLTAPKITDVLYSLVSDSDVLNYSDFEDWASDFGYDHDSRSAEKVYQACLKTALQLRNMLGDATLQQLNELFQDY